MTVWVVLNLRFWFIEGFLWSELFFGFLRLFVDLRFVGLKFLNFLLIDFGSEILLLFIYFSLFFIMFLSYLSFYLF